MKKMKKLVVLVLSLCFALGLTGMVLADPVYKEIQTTQVSDIAITPNTYSHTCTIPIGADKFEDYYKISLASPSYVCINGLTDSFGSFFVKCQISQNLDMSNYTEFWTEYDSTINRCNYVALEAGTYYIRFYDRYHESFQRQVSTFKFSVFSQPTSRDSDTLANSKELAAEILNGETIDLLGTAFNETQVAKFYIPNKAKVDVKEEFILPKKVSVSCRVIIKNSKGKEVNNKFLSNDYNTASTNLVLSKGTYYVYVQFTGSSEPVMGKADITIKYKATLDKPLLKKYKAKSKQITGTAKSGTKIIVKVNKKTYKVDIVNGKFTVKLKNKLVKGDKITVYAMDKVKNKSKVVTKNVK